MSAGATNKFVVVFLILGMILLFKPSTFSIAHQTAPNPHYTTPVSDCSSRTSTVSLCQVSLYCMLVEEELASMGYLFIALGLLFFIITPLISNSPYRRKLKPPILFA